MSELFRIEDIPCINLGQFLLESMRQHDKQSTALVDGTTGNSYTYLQLIDQIERAAAALQQFGVCKNDVICVMSPNRPEYLITFYASALIGATFQPVNPTYTKDDLKRVVGECNTKYLLTVADLLPKVEEALADNPGVKVVVYGEVEEGYTKFDSLIEISTGQYTTPECDAKKDVVALLSSSGTTGVPKSVQVSHYAIVANTLQQRLCGLISSNDCYVVFLPLFHMYGLYVVSLCGHHTGVKLVLMSKFQPDNYMQLIQTHKANILHVVPPIMVMFSKYPKVSDYDLTSVKIVVCGAAPLSKEIEAIVNTKLINAHIFQGYGMTEVGLTHVNTLQNFRYKAVGKLVPLVEMKIVNVDTGKTCGLNEEGEVWVRGPQLALGYLNIPEQNKRFFTDDGWARTGDIGTEDDDGYLFVVDRLKELIKYKAFQVAPATLEDILLNHDAVTDVGVIGVPDEYAGELPRAYVVKKADQTITEQELVDFVAGIVAPHLKLRGGVEFIDEIPRTLSGKILRRTLREKAKQ